MILLFLSALTSCSAESGSESAAAGGMSETSLPAPGAEEASTSPVELSKVAKITVAGATIEMSEIVGNPNAAIVISESFDMNRGSVLQRLTERQALTALEIFVSLQPEVDVPEVLSERHAAETVALGRSDTSVLYVAFEPNAAIAKWTSAQCDSVIFGNEGSTPGKIQYSRKMRFASQGGSGGFPLGGPGRWDFVPTALDVNLGVCNKATTAMEWWVYFWPENAGPVKNYTAPLPVNPGHASWYYRLYLGTLVTPPCPPGLICPPPVRSKVHYGITAFGADMLVRTAEARVVPPQIR